LVPGLYRIGALMPANGANDIVNDPATFQSSPGVSLVQFLRQIGSPTLAMPDLGPPYPSAIWFGPTFTFTLGPLAPSGVAVAPGNYTSTSGPGGLNTLLRNNGAPRTYQMQFSAAALGLPVGAKITELRFRLETNATAVFPTNLVTWSDYEVTLAQAANSIAAMSTNFAPNILSPALVKSGPLSLAAGSFTPGANPNSFGSLLVFDTPYVYQGGDLVMLFRHPGSDSPTTAFLDSLSSADPGYGTDFRAFSATSFGGTAGSQTSVTIAEIVFAPSIGATILRTETNVVVAGTGGLSGWPYRILASTDLGLPVSQWTPVATSQFDGSGSCRYTNAIDANSPTEFFRIAVP